MQELFQENLYTDIKETWELFPKGPDGNLHPDTVRHILSDQGVDVDKQDLEEVFALLDKNKDGKIDHMDFAVYQDV